MHKQAAARLPVLTLETCAKQQMNSCTICRVKLQKVRYLQAGRQAGKRGGAKGGHSRLRLSCSSGLATAARWAAPSQAICAGN